MSYEKFYPNGWQSGETGGTPITPEALNHIENGIMNSAPAGYGLGEEVKFVSSIDGLLVPGQYKFYNGGYQLIAGVPETNSFDLEVISSGSGCIHRITTHTGGYRAERMYNGASWGEWGWDNPPVVLGVEYRTTERWLGKAVWTCCLALGKFPANATINVPHNITMTYCICCAGIDYATGTTTPRITKEHSADIYLYSGIDEVTISTTTDFSSREAVVQLWYTKD